MRNLALLLALAVSVLLNLALLRRTPPAPPPTVVRTVVSEPASAPPVPAPAAAPVPHEPDAASLREENRKLREQLTVLRATQELSDSGFTSEALDQPDARDFKQMWELLESFIETRKVQARDGDGNPIQVDQRCLSAANRERAIHHLAEFLNLDGPSRAAFRGRMTDAIAHFRHVYDADMRDYVETMEATLRLQGEEKYEEAQAIGRGSEKRSRERQQRWEREHLQPLRQLLVNREGVRPSLLGRYLGEILRQLSEPEER